VDKIKEYEHKRTSSGYRLKVGSEKRSYRGWVGVWGLKKTTVLELRERKRAEEIAAVGVRV